MPSSANSTVLLAGSALLVAAAAAAFLPGTKSSTGGITEITDIDDSEEDFITEQDVCKIFDRLFMEMQAVLGQLGQQIQQLQMAGQQIPEAQLRQLLKSEFERALLSKQNQVFEEHDVDADCLEEATWEFLDAPDQYPDARKSVERFQKLWQNVSGENVVGKRPGKDAAGTLIEEEKLEVLKPDKLIEAAEVYFSSLTDAMRVIIQKYTDEGRDMNTPQTAQALQMEFASVANDAGSEALEKFGCTLAQFQKSVEANATIPSVGRALQMIQMKQQQEMMEMGLPGM